MTAFQNVVAWQKAHALALEVYRASASFPGDERFGLTSQMRRAATSIASNIAEGSGRGSDADYARFMAMALGSSSELEYQLMLARDLGFVEADEYRQLDEALAEVKRLLVKFRAALRSATRPPPIKPTANS